MQIVITKLNESTLHVKCDMDIAMAIREKFTFEVPGWRFTPKGKAGTWDGKIRLFDIVKRQLPAGLWLELEELLSDLNCVVCHVESDFGKITDTGELTLEDVEQYVAGLNLHTRGQPTEAHDYQIQAIYDSLFHKRRILHAVTGAGKSAILYCICRYIADEIDGRTLIVVPTISLTNQMVADFADYASGSDWSAEDNCHKISAGAEKNTNKKIVVSTFQSLISKVKDDPDWFSQFTCVLGDEGHKIKSAVISAIFEACTNAKYRLTCTGTLHDTTCHIMQMKALTGQVSTIATAKELISRGILTPLKIKCITLKHPDEVSLAMSKKDYDTEINYVASNSKRNKFIRNLALKSTGVTLVLFRYVDIQGKPLYDLLKTQDARTVHYIDGGVDGDEREDIRVNISAGSNDIIVASYGTFSTGINLPAIETIILAHPMKSKITLLQSIGRGLRLSKGKSECTLYDINDLMKYKSKINTTYEHFMERLKAYTREGYTFSVTTLDF